MHKRTIICLLAMLFASLLRAEGVADLDSLIRQAFQYTNQISNEKVYLHFDNTSYYMGEKLWFKAYVTTSQRSPTPLSAVLYVELRNQYGQLSEQQVLKVENGTACGEFTFHNKLIPGFYEVRAYTRWMRNFGETNYFSRVFPLYMEAGNGRYERELYRFQMSSKWDMKIRPEVKQENINIQFYPEGGHLVKDIPSVVAFRLSTKDELYPMGAMTLYSSKGDSIGEGYTIHDGMGKFVYSPSESPGYVKVNYKQRSYRFNLPTAASEGYCLSMSLPQRDSVKVIIRRSASMATDTLGLALVSGDKLMFATPVICDNSQLATLLPLAQFPGGVAQAFLFDKRGHILCERMFFVNQPKSVLSISAKMNKPIYAPGEQINLSVHIAQQDSVPAPNTDFSLSVRDALTSDLDLSADNARTNMLLSSELSGYIHRPEFYFLRNGSVRSQALDLLLLVQGWRKYNWEGVFSGHVSPEMAHPIEKGLMLEGRLKSALTKKPQANDRVSLMVKEDTTSFISTIRTDSAGRFRVPINDFKGRCSALFVANKESNGKRRFFCYFLIDRNYYPALRPYAPAEFGLQWDTIPANTLSKLETQEQEDLEREFGQKYLLDNVQIKAKYRRRPITVKGNKVYAYYDVENIIEEDADKGIEYASLEEFLRTRNQLCVGVPGSQTFSNEDVNNPNTVFLVDSVVSMKTHNARLGESILREVEGIKTLMYCEGTLADNLFANLWIDTSLRLSESSEDAELTSVQYDPTAWRGIYHITTTGDFQNMSMKNKASTGTRLTYIQGYNQAENFYSPDYSQQPMPSNKDHRRTLYWNPSLRTEADGSCKISLYNASNYTYLNINAETVTSQGTVGSVNMLVR